MPIVIKQVLDKTASQTGDSNYTRKGVAHMRSKNSMSEDEHRQVAKDQDAHRVCDGIIRKQVPDKIA